MLAAAIYFLTGHLIAKIGAVAQIYSHLKGTQRIIAADAHDTEAVAEAGRTVTGG